MKITKGIKRPPKTFHLAGNVFWQIENPAILRKSHDDHSLDEPLANLDSHGNFLANPLVVINDEKQLVIGDDNIARRLDLKERQALSLDSQWQITPEEKAMIPDDGTVESSKWKKCPLL